MTFKINENGQQLMYDKTTENRDHCYGKLTLISYSFVKILIPVLYKRTFRTFIWQQNFICPQTQNIGSSFFFPLESEIFVTSYFHQNNVCNKSYTM